MTYILELLYFRTTFIKPPFSALPGIWKVTFSKKQYMTDPVPQPDWRHMILLWKWINWHFSIFYSGIFRTFIISLLKYIFHVQNLITFANNTKICVYRHTNNLINFVPELLICFHNLIIFTNEITMYRHDILMWVLDLIICVNRIIISTVSHRIIISVLGLMICAFKIRLWAQGLIIQAHNIDLYLVTNINS